MAVRAERIAHSKKYPNFWKYEFDIEEKDGTITENVPAFGTNMEDALSSVELIERRSWLLRLFNKIPQWVAFITCGIVMTGAAILSEYFNTSLWVVAVLGGICAIGAGLYYLNHRIEMHMIDTNE